MIIATDVNAPPTYFTQREIDEICFLGEAGSVQTEGHVLYQGKPNHSVRATDISWIYPSEDTRWLYQKLWPIFGEWQINRLGPLQIGTYREGGHYQWHNDNGLRPEGQSWYTSDISNRVASVVINLSRPEDYKGGRLEILHPSGIVTAPNHRGSISAFTSSMMHRVTPITHGIRKTLVCWALR